MVFVLKLFSFAHLQRNFGQSSTSAYVMLQFTLLLFMCMGQTNLAQEDKGLEVSEEISKKGQRQGLQYIGVGYDMIKGTDYCALTIFIHF